MIIQDDKTGGKFVCFSIPDGTLDTKMIITHFLNNDTHYKIFGRDYVSQYMDDQRILTLAGFYILAQETIDDYYELKNGTI